MFGVRFRRSGDYAFAVILTVLMILAREVLSGWLGGSAPFATCTVAVLVASLRGGLGPGLVATALSGAVSDFFFVPPVFSLRMEKLAHGADLLLFIIIGVLISSLCEKRLRVLRELRDADRRKDEFLATLAHELRNPLAPISNAIEVWPAVEDDRTQLTGLRTLMRRQVQHLAHLVDDLMDVSRITRGKIQLRPERVDIRTIVTGAIEALDPLFKSCGHQVEVQLSDRPLIVEADAARLAQIFGNVLNNAAKYTGRNGLIKVVVEREGPAAVVRIKDNGPGIEPHMLTRIFEMFQQVDQTLDRSHGGLGIGLTLAKRLIELHGGTIEARSDGPGRGTEFAISLPALRNHAAVAERRKPVPSIRDLPRIAQHRILVVDDTEASASMLAMLLRAMGQEASTAGDGPTAIQWVREHHPDFVFLDLAMPGMDGYEVARRIRECGCQKVALVALSGYSQEEDRQRAFDAGFDRYLVKPANIEAIHELLFQSAGLARNLNGSQDGPATVQKKPLERIRRLFASNTRPYGS
jgi:signal transduction histidine kinase/ActR/RegA family two-component response regulator